MAIKLGIDAKLYFCAAGIGGTPTWTEINNVRNVTLDLKRAEADVTTRASGGWKATAAAMKEASIEFEMPYDPAADGFEELRDAWLNGTLVGLAVMDGAIATAGSQGLWADCAILDFSQEQPLEEAATVKVSAKPTASANAPQWKEIAGS
jgi:predicted secreted protein